MLSQAFILYTNTAVVVITSKLLLLYDSQNPFKVKNTYLYYT